MLPQSLLEQRVIEVLLNVAAMTAVLSLETFEVVHRHRAPAVGEAELRLRRVCAQVQDQDLLQQW